MRRLAGFLSLCFLLIIAGCQKELSVETSNIISTGTLQDDVTGDCLPKVVSGIYEEMVPLDGLTNTIEVTVDVVSKGKYEIVTDTVNGFSFSAVGVFSSTGTKTVILKGAGTPLSDGISNFTVTYGESECVVSVTVLPVGGSDPAVFTLAGSPGTCIGYQLEGSFIVGQALTNASYVDIDVNVSTIGTYNITTTQSNGFSFIGSGYFPSTGPATIRLFATGTPVVTGTTPVPITVGASICSFSVNVVSSATFTVSCGTASVDGDYIAGLELDATNTVDISVDVTALGGYTLSGTVNGMTFSGSGEFTALGEQTITLEGTGTPTKSGLYEVTLTGAASTCTFEVVVFPESKPATGTFSGTIGGTTSFTGDVFEGGFDPDFFSPGLYFYFYGLNTVTGDQILIELVDVTGGFQNNEEYDMASTTGNFGSFIFVGTTEDYYADPTVIGNTLKVKITNHDVANKRITGTFTGKAEDSNGVLQDITGTFTVEYE